MGEKQLNTKIPTELDKQLEMYCTKKDQTKKDVVAMALEQFLKIKK